MSETPPSAQVVHPEPRHDTVAEANAEPVVAFHNVSIAFDGPPVLQDVSFSVKPAESRILLGPAGVGKSVLLKLANGLLRPSQGSIQLFGQEISKMREVDLFPLRTRIGMVFPPASRAECAAAWPSPAPSSISPS
jgi:phospholipid/cholesterol/gamma-HCH transport system ATP-binding protein